MSKTKSHYWDIIEEYQLINDYPDPDYIAEDTYDMYVGQTVEEYLDGMYEYYKDKP
jgi:hypothetical protein